MQQDFIDRPKRKSKQRNPISCLYLWNTKSKIQNIFPLLSNYSAVSFGENHILAVSQKSLKAYGSNLYGQCGLGSHLKESSEMKEVQAFKTQKILVKSVFCGYQHSFVLTEEEQVFSFGFNLKGQLGLGHFSNRFQPQQVYSLIPSGIKNVKAKIIQEKRLSLLPVESPSLRYAVLSQDQFITNITIGPLTTIAQSSKKRHYICGLKFVNVKGRTCTQCSSVFQPFLQDFQISKVSIGISHITLLIGGKVHVLGKLGKLLSDKPIPITFEVSPPPCIIQLASGQLFSGLLSSKGEVWTIGQNTKGQLGHSNILFADKAARVIGLPILDYVYVYRTMCYVRTVDKRWLYWGSNFNPAIQDQVATPSQLSLPKFSGRLWIGNNMMIIESNDLCIDQEFQTKRIQDQISLSKSELLSIREENKTLRANYLLLMEKLQSAKEEQLKMSKVVTDAAIQCQTKSSQISKKVLSKFQVSGVDFALNKHRIFKNSLEINWKDLIIEKQISQGGFGIIFKGRWRETVVAIKKFKLEGMSQSTIRDFLSECHAMQAIRHPNIVMFLGACTKTPYLAIVLEYCSRGSLWSILQNQDIILTWQERRRISIQISKAILYLHLCSPPILHRDLKSLNVLLDQNLKVKIADFGWTRALGNYMTGKIGTYQWMAPEVIAGSSYTQKADVFSFGIVMWQIASREPPYRNINGQQVSIQVLNNDLRPAIPKKCPQSYAKLMRRCWQKDPQKRPNFLQIIKQLQSIKL